MRSAIIIAALVLMSLPASAQEPPKCNDEGVKAELAALIADQACLASDITIALVMADPESEASRIDLSKTITTKMQTAPASRTCEARLDYEAALKGTTLGPLPEESLRLGLKGGMDGFVYTIGVYDEGGIYVRLPDEPPCWPIETLTDLDAKTITLPE